MGPLLEIPEARWQVLSQPDFVHSVDLEASLSELLGKPLSFESLDETSQGMLVKAVGIFISTQRMSLMQAHDHFNALLTFYGERAVSLAFYRRFLGQSNFSSVPQFANFVHEFQNLNLLYLLQNHRAY